MVKRGIIIHRYVEWSSHEPSPGKFDFNGDLDVEHFIELAAKEDLLVILRPGPYIAGERDFVSMEIFCGPVVYRALGPVSPKIQKFARFPLSSAYREWGCSFEFPSAGDRHQHVEFCRHNISSTLTNQDMSSFVPSFTIKATSDRPFYTTHDRGYPLLLYSTFPIIHDGHAWLSLLIITSDCFVILL